ncbi:hypothetical protein [Romboutsia ilealis]|jgi:hypothetical protein|uniref:hypothetical protein n=1 Tax=Romboutsia ilealis TaxID=1115758 RepID=UPI0026F3FDBF|nr:hypothetical protein [Romboutsia ilealis]
MRFEDTEVWGFRKALRGMRNPKNSWDKSDSVFGYSSKNCYKHNNLCLECEKHDPNAYAIESPIIGKNDMKLAQQLIRAGSEHRKFMRQIFVSVDITAPLYWWKEFDTYKVGTVANSTSTMHKLATTPITLECFEIDDYDDSIMEYKRDGSVYPMQSVFVEFLEHIRRKYLETKDKKFWKELIRWLPESWLQTRTVTMSYENLLAMCSKGQRRFHKLNEWSGQDDNTKSNFISWARTLPYAQELIFIDEVEE